MKKINLVITGCLGRMGQQLVKSTKKSKIFKLVAVTENRVVNKKIFGLKPQLNSESTFKNANVIIDFTIPECTSLLQNRLKKYQHFWALLLKIPLWLVIGQNEML